MCIAYTRLGLSGVPRPRTIMHARDRERARLALLSSPAGRAANFVHRSSVTSAWGMRAACFCMREGASVAQKCQNAKYKPPWYMILAQSATCMWRKKVSVMTLRISSFQFCMFYLCATIISYGKITVYIENLTNWVLTSWNPQLWNSSRSRLPAATVHRTRVWNTYSNWAICR